MQGLEDRHAKVMLDTDFWHVVNPPAQFLSPPASDLSKLRLLFFCSRYIYDNFGSTTTQPHSEGTFMLTHSSQIPTVAADLYWPFWGNSRRRSNGQALSPQRLRSSALGHASTIRSPTTTSMACRCNVSRPRPLPATSSPLFLDRPPLHAQRPHNQQTCQRNAQVEGLCDRLVIP